MPKYLLEIIVFICGAVVMILEMVGSRILAPYLGTSVFVWTSLIGIILGCLSVGYWYGGKLADKHSDHTTFALIIFASAMACLYIVIVKTPLLVLVQLIHDIRIGAVISATLLFGPASLLLGMVSPFAAKLKLSSLSTSGATVGELYAISTVGSIVGTFLSGFFLISIMSNSQLILLLAGILLITSLLAHSRKYFKARIIMIIFLLFVFLQIDESRADILKGDTIDVNTKYSRVWIYDAKVTGYDRPLRVLITNPREVQSAMYIDDQKNELVFDYTKYYRLAEHFNPGFKKTYMLGGGAYSFPKDFLTRQPSSTIDVVEIDPVFTQLAKQYFNLEDNTRLKSIHEDGRIFLNENRDKYDVAYLDAFHSFYSVPYYLTTEETVKKVYDSLNDNGIVLMNIISAIEGDKGKFLRAEYATYRKVFPQVYILPVKGMVDPAKPNNIILVAIKSKTMPAWTSVNKEFDSYLKFRWTKDIPEDMPILTDDFAPVDQYIMKLL